MRGHLLRCSVAASVVLLVAAAAGAETVFPENAGSRGGGVDELFWLATWSGAVAFAIVVGILLYSIVMFRARPGHRAAYATGDGRGARTFTSVFAMVVFVTLDVNLAIKDHAVFEEMYGSAPPEAESLVVDCLAKQFEWHFRYAGRDGVLGNGDDVLTVNVLHVPSDRSTLVRMKSVDVVHSFFLPHFRTKQDAVPGMMTSIWIHPAKEGSFDIACAELCGQGHYDMNGTVVVESPAAFAAWTAAQQAELDEYGQPAAAEEIWPGWNRNRTEKE